MRSKSIRDKYSSLSEVEQALRKAGLESSDMILAIDWTKSNMWSGEKSFGGRCLHELDGIVVAGFGGGSTSSAGAGSSQEGGPPGGPGSVPALNFYQQVISTLADVLVRRLDDDGAVPMIGFGDARTRNTHVFSMTENDKPCTTKQDMLDCYERTARSIVMSGPTSFAPIINEAVAIVRETGRFHCLVILADGGCDDVQATVTALVSATKYALAVIVIGIGDGPWDVMRHLDEELPNRDFDNLRLVVLSDLYDKYPDPHKRAIAFAQEALTELPSAYQQIKALGLLDRKPDASVKHEFRMKVGFAAGGGAAPPLYR
jgi:E3 ubiquitin-protein ligase RGLG